eukprot:4928165-Amphidinium_carterae.1
MGSLLGSLMKLTDIALYRRLYDRHYFLSEDVWRRFFEGGTLPMELGRLSNLMSIYIADCHLQGSIPAQVFRLPMLERLYLPHNGLTGTLPNVASRLLQFHVESNDLAGSLPDELVVEEHLDVQRNRFAGSLQLFSAQAFKKQ